MSRRTGRTAARRSEDRPSASAEGQPAACCHDSAPRGVSRSQKWLLAAAILLQAAWILFLIAMAMR